MYSYHDTPCLALRSVGAILDCHWYQCVGLFSGVMEWETFQWVMTMYHGRNAINLAYELQVSFLALQMTFIQ